MFGKISEVEVKASISEAWEVYSTLKAAMIVNSELAHRYGIDLVEGDGGVGTVLRFTPQGESTKQAFKERFTKIDHAKRVKEVEIIEGGYLDLGFTSYRIKLELMEKQNEDTSCILRVTVEYEANEDVVPDADGRFKSLIDTLEVINKYIQNNST